MRRRVRLGAHVWWDAVSSGAYFTLPALLVTLLLTATVLAPLQHYKTPADLFASVLVGVAGWALLVIALVPVTALERRLPTVGGRAALVLTATVAAAAARPFINEGLFFVFFGTTPMLDGVATRIISNLFTWLAALSVVAMTVRSVQLTRGTRGRLNTAVSTLSVGRRRLARFENDNRAIMADMIDTLRTERERMLAGPLDFAAVRDYSETVRAGSHRLEERSRLSVRLLDAGPDDTTPDDGKVSLLSLLRPTPYGVTGIVFLAGALPYANGIGGPATAFYTFLIGMPLTLVADIAIRVLGRGRDAASRGAAIVAAWAGTGILVTLLAHALVDRPDPSRLVPLVSMPIVAIALAACTDAIARSAASSRRLEAVLGLVARTLTAKTGSARRPLRHAAHVLHGRVQGRCVMLAAYADEGALTDEDIAKFRADTDAAFDSVLDFAAEDNTDTDTIVQSAHEDLDELVATWGAVLEVTADISQAAADVLVDPEISRKVATVVNEGFVNAVKHSEAKQVWLSIGVEENALLVRTWSIGVLDRGAAPRSGDLLGTGARIFQRGDQVVLEVPVPLCGAAATGGTADVIPGSIDFGVAGGASAGDGPGIAGARSARLFRRRARSAR
ncbi:MULTISPECIES: hypothetical protein [unclassified Microbacterium]|uniref:hypothetical protein n=1 Tax=unclassified Microbacterium TaxID=2609290 RepID=UPI0038655A43